MAVILGACLVRAPARAADAPAEIEGRTLFAKGEYQKALDVFAALFARTADPVYLRNIGRCQQKLHRPAPAIDAFEEYLRRVPGMKPSERAEIKGFIAEMNALRDAQAASAAPAGARASPAPAPLPLP